MRALHVQQRGDHLGLVFAVLSELSTIGDNALSPFHLPVSDLCLDTKLRTEPNLLTLLRR